MPGHAPMEQCEGLRASVKDRLLALTTPSDNGMPVFLTLAGPGSETGSGAGAEILARQRWHREYCFILRGCTRVHHRLTTDGHVGGEVLRAEGEKRDRTGEVERRADSNFLRTWHKKIEVVASPNRLPCRLGPTDRGRGGPGLVPPTVGALGPGRVASPWHHVPWPWPVPFRSTFIRRPNFGSTWSGMPQNGCVELRRLKK